MTAQLSDFIKFEGRVFEMASEPLAFWLARRKNKGLRFRRPHTALSRGYVASWEVSRGRLYLTKFSAQLADGTPVTVDALFKNYSSQYLDSVKAFHPSNAGPGQFAFWLTATVRCPIGELIEYKHFGYCSVYERELMLEFREGFLVGSRIIINEPLERPSPVQKDVLTELELEEEEAYRADRERRRSVSERGDH